TDDRDFARDGSIDHESAEDGRAGHDAERRLRRNSQDRSRRRAHSKRAKGMKRFFVRHDRPAFAMLRLGRHLVRAAGALTLLLLLSAWGNNSKDRFKGYVEGEFVYVASPLAGQLETLAVQRGQQVTTGQPLFALD